MALKTNEEQAIVVVELTEKIEALVADEIAMINRHNEERERIRNQIDGARGHLKTAKEKLAQTVTHSQPMKVFSVNGSAVIVRKEEEVNDKMRAASVEIVPHVKVK